MDVLWPVPATTKKIVGLALNNPDLSYRACNRVLIVVLEKSQQSLLFKLITCKSNLDHHVSCRVNIYNWSAIFLAL